MIIADLMVLTEPALQVAMSEKNVTDTFRSADDRLFSPMDTN